VKRFLPVLLAASVVVSSAQAICPVETAASVITASAKAGVPSVIVDHFLLKGVNKFSTLSRSHKVATVTAIGVGIAGLIYGVSSLLCDPKVSAEKLYAEAQKTYDRNEKVLKGFSGGDIAAFSAALYPSSAYPLVSFFNEVSGARGAMQYALRIIEKALKLSTDVLFVQKCEELDKKLITRVRDTYPALVELIVSRLAWDTQYSLYEQECKNEEAKIAHEKQNIAHEQQRIAAEKQKVAHEKQKVAREKQRVATEKREIAHKKQNIAYKKQKAAQQQKLASHKQEVPDSMPDWY